MEGPVCWDFLPASLKQTVRSGGDVYVPVELWPLGNMATDPGQVQPQVIIGIVMVVWGGVGLNPAVKYLYSIRKIASKQLEKQYTCNAVIEKP